MNKKGFIPPYILAAQITFLISTIWVLQYLTNYEWGTRFMGTFIGTRIFDIITTSMKDADHELGSTALFIIFSRYLLSFGILWPVLSWIISIFYALIDKNSDKEKVYRLRTNKETFEDTDNYDDLPKL